MVDVGISCRETEQRMKRQGLSMDKVKAIFISHEHSDHIKGLPVLSKKYNLPVYITAATLRGLRFGLQDQLVNSFSAYEPVQIGGLAVTAFPKFHDAADPHSFIVSCGGINVGVFTDIGTPCDHVIRQFQQCHAAFLETNYDEELLDKGFYPYHLKVRIRSNHGHLSNRQALALFTAYKPAFMSHVLLGHLSKQNNCPQLVEELFTKHADGTQIVVASRYEESKVYIIDGPPVSVAVSPVKFPKVVEKMKPVKRTEQLSLDLF